MDDASAQRPPGPAASPRTATAVPLSPDAAPAAPDPDGQPSGPDPDSPPEATTRPRDHQRPPLNWRRTLWALWVAQSLAIIAFSMRGPFLPFFLGDLGMHDVDAQTRWSGYIASGGALCMAISAPIWGMLSDRIGRRPMVIRSMLVATFTIGLMGLATAPWQLLGLRLVEGLFTGTVTACAALVAATVPRDQVGFALGLIQTAVFSGSSLGPLFGGFLANEFGYRWTFAACSAFMFSGVLIVLFLVEERFQPQVRKRAGRSGIQEQLAVLAIPLVLVMAIAMLVIRGSSMAIQPILPLFVESLPATRFGAAQMTGFILGAQGLTSAVAAIYFGRLGDRVGHRRILTLCTFGAGFLYMPMAIATQSWQLLILQALFGITAGGLVPAANALVSNATRPEERGVVFGLMAGAGSLGAFAAPLAVTELAATNGFGASFVMLGLALLLTAGAIVYAFTRTPEDDAGQPAGQVAGESA